jgi:hypothetical protein
VDAYIDLSDFGIAACSYPEYRTWLAGLKDSIISAQRVRGGLRLQLAGDTASTHVPVTCHVLMRTEKKPKLTHVGIYYRDVLEKNDQGWRIISRKEELSWSS